MTSGARDFSLVLTAKMLVLIIALGTQSALAWLLGTTGRGQYAICIVFTSLLSVIFNFGFYGSSVYFVSSSKFNISEGITHALLFGTIVSLLAVTAGLVIMQFNLPFLDKAETTSFYLALASVPTGLFAHVFSLLFTAIHQFGWFAFTTVFTRVLHLVLTLLFVAVFPWQVRGAILAVIFSGLITILLSFFLFIVKFGARFTRPSLAHLYQLFHYGVRAYAGSVMNVFNVRLGTMVLAFFAAPAEIGIFDVAFNTTARTMIIPNSLHTTLIPKVAANPDRSKALIPQCARITAVISFIALAAIAIFATPLVRIVFSPDFLPAVPMIRILAIGVLIRGSAKIFGSYLMGTNHPGILSLSICLGLIVNIIVLWLLLPQIGIIAAPIAVCANYVVTSTVHTWAYMKCSGLKFLNIWKFKREDWNLIWGTITRIKGKIIRLKS